MYLSAERLGIANKAVRETFEQTSIAWQAIPHWETGDPAQTKVRCDSTYMPKPDDKQPLGEDPVPVLTFYQTFYLTVAQASAPTPDALLAAVIARTVYLADRVDSEVFGELHGKAKPGPIKAKEHIPTLLNALIDARAELENVGYRAPSCLLVNTVGLKAISQLDLGYPVLKPLLDAANVNSRYRVEDFVKRDQPKGVPVGAKGTKEAVEGHGDEKPAPDDDSSFAVGTEGTKHPVEAKGTKEAVEGHGDEKPAQDDDSSFAVGTEGTKQAVGAEGTKHTAEGEAAEKPGAERTGWMLLLGRRQRIAHGAAATATAGEEPVDLAVSAPPSLEVIGETKNGDIELAVRIRFATRVKDKNGVVGVVV
jgi:hypothetical protein